MSIEAKTVPFHSAEPGVRHKPVSRCLRNDLRLWLPLLGFLCCYSLSATAIVVTERASTDPQIPEMAHFLTISSSSTSNASAAPGRMRGGEPPLP